MKLIIAIAHERNKNKLADALLENGFPFTKLGSTGGFLRQGNVTVLIGVEDDQVERVLEIIQAVCGASEQFVNVAGEMSAASIIMSTAQPLHPVKVETGGAVAFVVSVENFQRF
jgi:uncharacterized protein YaaQ